MLDSNIHVTKTDCKCIETRISVQRIVSEECDAVQQSVDFPSAAGTHATSQPTQKVKAVVCSEKCG